MHLSQVLPSVVVCMILGQLADAQESMRILPQEVTLSGPESRHRILPQVYRNDEAIRWAESAELTSDRPDVVCIEQQTLIPVSNGTATIRASAFGSIVAEQSVTVTGMDQPFHWSFRNHVEPVLARLGCSSGACHGALAGKGGFRISLRGYDPERDYFTRIG